MAVEVTWRGASANSHTFSIFPDGQKFNPVPGVYVFCRPLSNGNWEAFYVGETASFEQRLNTGISNHEGYQRAQPMGMTHIGVMVVPGEEARLWIETDLRHGLNPPANAQSNPLGGAA